MEENTANRTVMFFHTRQIAIFKMNDESFFCINIYIKCGRNFTMNTDESMIAIFKGGGLAIHKNPWDNGHYFRKKFNK